MRRLQVALEEIMRGKRGVAASLYRGAATPFAWVYGLAVKWRNRYYDRRGGFKVSIPVISVGNILAGGTGKTDVVELLARELPGKPAIVSRGYGVKIEKPFVVSKDHGADVCGDEPRLLADRLPNCLVIVGPNRLEGARLAEEMGASVVILDDGMQHRRLHRDFEVVVSGKAHHFLPKGLLRDDPKQLERADLLVTVDEKTCEKQCLMRSKIEGIFSLAGEKIETLRGVKVALFCGIGNPSRFVKTVEELGAEILEVFFLPDHEKADEKQLESLLRRSEAKYLICTEKDKVKLKSSLPIVWVKRRLCVDDKDVNWQKALAKVRAMI